MNNPKDPANAAHSAARRQNAALQGHDDARDAIKDLCNRRAKGEPPAQLRARDSTFGCQTMRRLAPDHQHRLKDEAYCRELMALTTYRLRDIVRNRRPLAARGMCACGDRLPSRRPAGKTPPCRVTMTRAERSKATGAERSLDHDLYSL